MVKAPRVFNFAAHPQRWVAFELCYLGAKYDGFASQESTEETIEGHLFAALKKTCLVESRENSGYTRCARTDKGVSATNQVISLKIRSSLSPSMENGVIAAAAAAETNVSTTELPYIKMLNGVLPKDIRILRWSPIDESFNARFSCIGRTYKYFFMLGDLDLSAMEQAAAHLVGTHDFRYFCKVDPSKKSTNYERTVKSATFHLCLRNDDPRLSGYYFEISATAFLWHQVRAIVAVLFLVGQHQKPPEVVLEMLDLDKCKKKPQYQIASELPLLLTQCHFPVNVLHWQCDSTDAEKIAQVLEQHHAELLSRALLAQTIAQSFVQSVAAVLTNENDTKRIRDVEDNQDNSRSQKRKIEE